MVFREGLNFFLEKEVLFDCGQYRFEQIAAVSMIEFLELLISDYKDASFAEEIEYRLELSIEDFQQEKEMSNIKFRSNNSMMIPYVELETEWQYFQKTKSEDEPEPTFLTKQLPIEEIIIGSSLDFEEVVYGLKLLLKKQNYENVNIKKSGIPYRS